MRQDGTPVPELSLAHLIDNMLLEQAEALTHSPDELPCSGILTSVPDIFRTQWVEHCGWQRVLHNVKELESELAALRYNWLQLTWEKLAGTMGGPANKEAMQRLARKVPFAVVGTHLSDAETLEGILFGAANLLPSPSSDPYVTKLTSAWKHYSLKHRIEPLPLGSFKFGRMRPHSFPTLRIAQLVSLLGSGTALMQLIAQPSELARILPNLAVSPFWEIHYTFADTPRYTPKTIGKSFADGLLINCFMPLSVLYHTILGKDSVMENTLEVLNGLAPEDNSVVRQMKQAGFDAKTALDTQGLLHLYRNWCTPRNCLDCGIGHKLLSSNLLATKR
jgi:hypothetical protein